MKIVLIHGQNHKGSTCHIGRLLADQFAESEISEFFLPRDLNHFCLGCCRCIDDEAACPFYEEKRKILDKIEDAELLIFTTPTYCMRASAPMKSFIDLTFTNWMPHKPKAYMFHKKAVVISTAAGMGTGSAIKDITISLFYWGVPYIKTYGTAVQAINWDGVAEKKKTKIERDMVKLAAKVSRQKARVPLKTRGLFLIMRMMQKAGWSPAEQEHWRSQGWLDSARPWKA